MDKYADLKKYCFALGSLPHNNPEDAIAIIKKYKSNIPFCPQLVNYSKNEDMLIQFLEGMPAISFVNGEIFIDETSIEFKNKSKEILEDFECISKDINCSKLDKYSISEDYSISYKGFLEAIYTEKFKYVKAQITGPFTLSFNIVSKLSEYACYSDFLVELITKFLALKTLWQIREIKKASNSTIPIIFIDEPTLAQLNKEKFRHISKFKVAQNIKLISDLIKKYGAISAIHCCGDCDWSEILKIGVDIINFDAYTYSEEMKFYIKDLKKFLENGGKIMWGIVPTLNKEALKRANIEEIMLKLSNAKEVLIKNGIDRELVEKISLLSPSCGCATLSVELTEKTFQLSESLVEKLKG